MLNKGFVKRSLALSISLLAFSTVALGAMPVTLHTSADKPLAILCPENKELEQTAQYISKYLSERGVQVKKEWDREYIPESTQPLLIVARMEDLKAMKLGDWPHNIDPSAGDEAFIYSVETKGDVTNPDPTGDQLQIYLIGKSPAGVRLAAGRMICRLVNNGKTLWLRQETQPGEPFIDSRLIMLCPSARRQTPPGSPFEDADFETWTTDRLKAYPELFWQFGYNGMQLAEIRGYGSTTGNEIDQEELPRVRRTIQTLANSANRLHMYVSLFQWGDCLFTEDYPYSWYNPNERATMQKYMDESAKAYANVVDHIHVHIGDPGGCTRDGCDLYRTPQEVASAWLAAYQAVSSDVEGTLSTWANAEFWKHSPEPISLDNYKPIFPWLIGKNPEENFGHKIPGEEASFLDTTYMSQKIAIALNREFNQEQADALTAAGRQVDVWSWYLGDIETINNLWLTMESIDRLLSRLPEKAHEQIRIHTMELCFHGWPNVINSYVGAQKLIDPKRDLGEIEREFCTATFGPQNAETMVKLYQACENYGGDLSKVYVIPRPADFGTKDYNDRLRKLVDDAQKVKLPEGFKPNFEFPVPAVKYVEMLTARVRLMLAVSEAELAVRQVREKENITARPVGGGICMAVLDNNGQQIISPATNAQPVKLAEGHTIGQTFRTATEFSAVGVLLPTWQTDDSGLTLTLYDKVGGKALATRKIANAQDNQVAYLESWQPAGSYYLELTEPVGQIGIYFTRQSLPEGFALYFDRENVSDEHPEIAAIKKKAIESLPELPVDPIYKQDESVVYPAARCTTFKEMIQGL